MSLEVIKDSTDDGAIEIVLRAPAWQQPVGLNWLERARRIGKLLRKTPRATHLLRVVDANAELETWHAGRAGVSMAAALEKLALAHEEVRDAVALAPLANRMYFAEMNGTLVQKEGALFPEAVEENVRQWLASDRRVVQVATTNSLRYDRPDIETLDANLELDQFRFIRASVAMLQAKLVRIRDCVLMLVAIALFVATWPVYRWLAHIAINEIASPLEIVQSGPPVQPSYDASAMLTRLAVFVTDLDQDFWLTHEIERFAFDPSSQKVALYRADEEQPLINQHLEPNFSSRVIVEQADLAQLRSRVNQLFSDMNLNVTWEEAFETSMARHAQRFSANLATFPTLQLIDLADNLRKLPVRLMNVECSLGAGEIETCLIVFGIQGRVASV